MSEVWKTKYGPRRVRKDPPTLQEAIAAARGLTDDIGEQVEIAASLMEVPHEQVKLGGRWSLQPGAFSRSPAVPQALSIDMTEDGTGVVQGTLDARYRSKSKTERVTLSFAGRVVNGVARFPFNASDGRRGEIEFIRIPNTPDKMEVVWYGTDLTQPFDEIVKRGN